MIPVSARLATLALLLAACAQPQPAPREQPFVVQTNETARAMTLSVRQELLVRLPGNPSTGYGWSLVSALEILAQEGKPVFEQQAAPAGMVGVPGNELWKFRALRGGQQLLRFEYRRSWEAGSEPAQTATYQITVR